MIGLLPTTTIFLATAPTDLRKAYDGDNCTRADPAYGQGVAKALGMAPQTSGNKERT